MNIANFKLVNREIEELFINFIVPENFLIDFYIKDLIIKNIENNSNKDKKPPSIGLKDIEIFINNLCKNVIINIKGGCDYSFNGEYLEYKRFIVKVRELFFIEKKHKNSLDYGENNCINHNLSGNCRRVSKRNNNPLKKINKINNKKSQQKFKMKLNRTIKKTVKKKLKI